MYLLYDKGQVLPGGAKRPLPCKASASYGEPSRQVPRTLRLRGLVRLGTSSARRAGRPDGWADTSSEVPAQWAGLPARQAGTSPAGRSTCLPSWNQPSGQVCLLAKAGTTF
ncbi:hypothetical protein PCASD_23956 [Puccinia coronata f. sp. avenae]|uniref:Uncharacterized protein n=1 Tax=Puccinia coronata f. sp. avenae TaxID=200324 RepID=A0A2N5U0X7_9BASI|nr:hypothetical protein PCASD_23956 [Puccinia coronata f. sp. avenae]